MPVKMDDLIEALSMSDASDQMGFVVYLNKQTGETYTDYDGDDVGLPEDYDNPELYVQVPTSRELDLGPNIVFDFAYEHEEHSERISEIFSRKGAYRRFSDYLDKVGLREAWWKFEEQAKATALREFCEEEGVDLV